MLKHTRSIKLLLWLKDHWTKLVAFGFWLAVVVGYWVYARIRALTVWEVIRELASVFLQDVTGPLLFIVMFTFQPLVFFPSAVMGVISGTLYGPYWGFLYTSIGAVGAATVTYWVGYFFGRPPAEEADNGRLGRYHQFLHTNTFETLIFLHLIFAPYDFVNYFSGYLRLRWWPFITAAFIGSIPGMITFVLFGASLELENVNETPQLNLRTLAISILMLIISLSISRLLKRREQKRLEKSPS